MSISDGEKYRRLREKVDIFVHTKMHRGDLRLISYTKNSDKQQGNAGY